MEHLAPRPSDVLAARSPPCARDASSSSRRVGPFCTRPSGAPEPQGLSWILDPLPRAGAQVLLLVALRTVTENPDLCGCKAMCSRPGTIAMNARVHCVRCARSRSRALLTNATAPASGGLETVNEVWASTTSFSAPRVWFSVFLFVGGEEAISRRGCAPPPPIARPPVAFSRRLALRTRASTLNRLSSRALCGRGGAPLHAQGSSSTYVRCACRAARPPACSGGGGERPSRRRLAAPRWLLSRSSHRGSAAASPWASRRYPQLDYPHGTGGGRLGGRRAAAERGAGAVGGVAGAPLSPVCGTCRGTLCMSVSVY